MVGGYVALTPVVLSIVFGIEEVSTVLGTNAVSGILGNLFGPPIAGFILGSSGSGSYIGVAIFAGATLFMAGVLFLVLRMMRADGKLLVKL